jgi:hypothetical protein
MPQPRLDLNTENGTLSMTSGMLNGAPASACRTVPPRMTPSAVDSRTVGTSNTTPKASAATRGLGGRHWGLLHFDLTLLEGLYLYGN